MKVGDHVRFKLLPIRLIDGSSAGGDICYGIIEEILYASFAVKIRTLFGRQSVRWMKDVNIITEAEYIMRLLER